MEYTWWFVKTRFTKRSVTFDMFMPSDHPSANHTKLFKYKSNMLKKEKKKKCFRSSFPVHQYNFQKQLEAEKWGFVTPLKCLQISVPMCITPFLVPHFTPYLRPPFRLLM